MPRTMTRGARLDLRLAEDDKELIERAAGLTGLSVSQFVASRSLEAARQVVSEHRAILMSQRDFDAFVASLTAVTPPSDAAQSGAAPYNAWRTGREPLH